MPRTRRLLLWTLAATLMAALPIAGQSRALLTFGAVTDLHFADIDPSGTRVYRESDTKLAEFVRTTVERDYGNASEFFRDLVREKSRC